MYFFFNDTATTEIYTLSLHDALPISVPAAHRGERDARAPRREAHQGGGPARSEEHTSELQSRQYLVCRLLLEKKTYFSSASITRFPLCNPPGSPPVATTSPTRVSART